MPTVCLNSGDLNSELLESKFCSHGSYILVDEIDNNYVIRFQEK